VGADTLAVSVTVIGSVPASGHVARAGARPGDAVVVVGSLGGAAAGLLLHRAGLAVPDALGRAHRRPEALPDAGRMLAREGATAMIDVSDGFGADLGHLCAASGVVARVTRTALPIGRGVAAAAERLGIDPWDLVVAGGDDYALVATVPRGRVEAIMDALGAGARAGPRGASTGAPDVRVVGTVTAPDEPAHDGGVGTASGEVVLVDGDRETRITGRGFDHYADEPHADE
jgi:thiamine-monophosphate kinase